MHGSKLLVLLLGCAAFLLWSMVALAADAPVFNPVWEFSTPGDSEGWVVRKSVELEVVGGSLLFKVVARDPGMLSSAGLGIPAAQYNALKIRMRNDTEDVEAAFFFITEDDRTWNDAKVILYSVEANSDWVEYVIPLEQNPNWQGRIEQLRVDALQKATSGTAEIDYIQLIRVD
jgi:hypothetical protein